MMKAILFGALLVLGSATAVAQTTGMEGLICEIDSPRMPRPTYMAMEIVKKASGLSLLVRRTEELTRGTRFQVEARMIEPIYANKLEQLSGLRLQRGESTLEFHSPGRDFEGKATIDATFIEDEIEYELGGCKVNAGNRLGF